jgi:hypothetical protein
MKKALTLVIAILLIAPILAAIHPASAATATVSMVNPNKDGYPLKWTAGEDPDDLGTNNFNFSSTSTSYGQTFFMNVTIQDADKVRGWGVGIVFENATLQYVSAWLPPDHIFNIPETNDWTFVKKFTLDDFDATHKILKAVASYAVPDPPNQWSFNGSGTLCQVQFQIIASVDRLNPLVTALFRFDPDWTSVALYPSGNEIPNFGNPAAYFRYEWATPTTLPIYYVKPSYYKDDTMKKGDTVWIEVWVRSVDPGWSIIGFQFSLWFNTSCLMSAVPGVGGVDYIRGTWLDTFENNGEDTTGIAFDDYHGVDPELPYCFNKWFAVEFTIKGGDPPQYFAPYPSGEGMLFRFKFTVMDETIFPNVYNTTLLLHDVETRDKYGLKVESWHEDGIFRLPIKKLGLNIDLYACRDGILQINGEWVTPPSPYNGAGPNNPSDMYQPQAEVDLQALVTYNEDPVQQKLVGFEIVHGEFYIYRENYTDVNGVAWINFRIPWPCDDPAGRVLGIWHAIATVEVAKQVVNDTMDFKVWWPVEIVSVTPKETEYTKSKPQPATMEFDVVYRTYRMQPIDLVLTVEVYDELGFHIGSDTFNTTVGWDEYHWCEFKYYTHTFSMPIPTNAAVGTATVYADAFDKLPWDGGTPYCPEASATFFIKKAP